MVVLINIANISRMYGESNEIEFMGRVPQFIIL